MLWAHLPSDAHFLLNKLLTVGFRVGVSSGLVSRATAQAFGLEEPWCFSTSWGALNPPRRASRR